MNFDHWQFLELYQWNSLNSGIKLLTVQQYGLLMTLEKKTVENIEGKGENAGSLNVSYLSQNKFKFFSHIYFVVCKCFQFEPV